MTTDIAADANNFQELFITGDLVKTWWARGLARIMGAIPIRRRRPKAARSAMETAREALNNGELVCIFPEGGITSSGQLGALTPVRSWGNVQGIDRTQPGRCRVRRR